MTTRYRLATRGKRGGMFYCVDKTTCKCTNLQTTEKDEAQQIIAAKNQAEFPHLLLPAQSERMVGDWCRSSFALLPSVGGFDPRIR